MALKLKYVDQLSLGRCLVVCVLLVPGPTHTVFMAAQAQESAPWVGSSLDGEACIGKSQGFGPFDYLRRAVLKEKLTVVENYHFTARVENLVAGESGRVEGDLDYTLRAWPNHHRALHAMVRFQAALDSLQKRRLRGLRIPAPECYLERALVFSPRDATVHMLMAMHLHRLGLYEKAEAYYRQSLALSPNELQVLYNLGLLLIDVGRLEEAEKVAATVYAQDFPLQGLRNRLSDKREQH